MIIRQDVIDAAQAALAAWGYHDPQLVHDLYSAQLLPGAAYSSHWYLQFRVRKGLDAPSPPVYVRLIVQEVSGRLVGRDHEEARIPFTMPVFRPATRMRTRDGSARKPLTVS
jgi:hypothetical protein